VVVVDLFFLFSWQMEFNNAVKALLFALRHHPNIYDYSIVIFYEPNDGGIPIGLSTVQMSWNVHRKIVGMFSRVVFDNSDDAEIKTSLGSNLIPYELCGQVVPGVSANEGGQSIGVLNIVSTSWEDVKNLCTHMEHFLDFCYGLKDVLRGDTLEVLKERMGLMSLFVLQPTNVHFRLWMKERGRRIVMLLRNGYVADCMMFGERFHLKALLALLVERSGRDLPDDCGLLLDLVYGDTN